MAVTYNNNLVNFTTQNSPITIYEVWTPNQVEWSRPIWSVLHVGSLKRPKHAVHEER